MSTNTIFRTPGSEGEKHTSQTSAVLTKVKYLYAWLDKHSNVGSTVRRIAIYKCLLCITI